MIYRDERVQGDGVGGHPDQDSQKAVDAGHIQGIPWVLFYIYKVHIFFCCFHLHVENIVVNRKKNTEY